MPMVKITGAQIRAARCFLSWSRDELAERAKVSRSTVQAIEGAEGEPSAKDTGVERTRDHRSKMIADSLEKIVNALVKAGCTFLPDDGRGVGVRRKMRTRS